MLDLYLKTEVLKLNIIAYINNELTLSEFSFKLSA